MLIVPSPARILSPVPRREWREPSQRQCVYGIENRTWFQVTGRTSDGALYWRGWFEDRDEADRFLWHLLRMQFCEEPIPPEIRRLPVGPSWPHTAVISGWHPARHEGEWYPEWSEYPIVYAVDTVSFITSSPGSTQSWPVPVDWSNTNHVDTIGGAGSGGANEGAGTRTASGGGGGAWNRKSNISTLTPGGTATVQAGGGGTAVVSSGAATAGNPGTATFFNGANLAASTVGSDFGKAGAATGAGTATGGAGGTAASGVGDSGNDGGRGGSVINPTGGRNGAGGGGAAGPSGAGNQGVDISAPSGSNSSNGGSGDAGSGGTAGTGAAPTGGTGGAGAEYTANPGGTTAGSGGGGGGSGASTQNTAGSGGNYGGGGGGCGAGTTNGTSGAGIQGIIIVTYTPSLIKTGWLGSAADQRPTVVYQGDAGPSTFTPKSTPAPVGIAGIAWWRPADDTRLPPRKVRIDESAAFFQTQFPVAIPSRWPLPTGEDVEHPFPIKRSPDEATPWFRPSQVPVPQRWPLPTGKDVERIFPIPRSPDEAIPFFTRSPSPVPVRWLPLTGGDLERIFPLKHPPDFPFPWFVRSPNPVSGMAWFIPPEPLIRRYPPTTDQRWAALWPPEFVPAVGIKGIAWFRPPEDIIRQYPGNTNQLWSVTWTPIRIPPGPIVGSLVCANMFTVPVVLGGPFTNLVTQGTPATQSDVLTAGFVVSPLTDAQMDTALAILANPFAEQC